MDAARTRERLLDAAERLFAERGFRATSLRALTSRAKANVAAVNYHFGSKGGLIRAAYDRRIGELNRERLALLEGAGRRRPAPEAILRAFIAPTIALLRRTPHFMELMGRLESEPDGSLREFVFRKCEGVVRRFERALRAALPRVPVVDLFWRMHFVMGALIHTWTCHENLERISNGRCSMRDETEITRKLIAFGAAGMAAPVGGRRRSPPRN